MTTWFSRLKDGLKKSSTRLTSGITTLITHRKLDDETLEELEELLITSDLGVATARDLIQKLSKNKYNQNITPEEIRAIFSEEIEVLLTPVAQPLIPQGTSKPFVVLVLGVNGAGKTTTIGKLAKQWKDAGHKLSLVAGDTFRAAATEQLEIWAKRANVPLEMAPSKDAASLVYDALEKAKGRGDDIVMIDTAGRLHTRFNLMEELKKVNRVVGKALDGAPHEVWLVLDATTGQNALQQARSFKEAVHVTGVILSKLDSSARGGMAFAIQRELGLPILFAGLGEKPEDLQPFDPDAFVDGILSNA